MAPTVKAVASDKSTSPPVLKFNGVLIVIGNGYNNLTPLGVTMSSITCEINPMIIATS